VFDVARRLLAVDLDDGREVARSEHDLTHADPVRKTADVAALGVDVLVCGAISRPLEAMLSAAGVRVIPQVCGLVEPVLAAYASGRLTEEAFLMPGCCGRRRGRHGRRGRGGPRW
jgi:predicted Fe-Mo cluster-binding NifX family protein